MLNSTCKESSNTIIEWFCLLFQLLLLKIKGIIQWSQSYSLSTMCSWSWLALFLTIKCIIYLVGPNIPKSITYLLCKSSHFFSPNITLERNGTRSKIPQHNEDPRRPFNPWKPPWLLSPPFTWTAVAQMGKPAEEKVIIGPLREAKFDPTHFRKSRSYPF